MPFRIYPTVAEAIEIHRLLIEEFGGLGGIRDRALLESVIFRPQSGYYHDLFEEAAALMESLSNNQAFLDANKRVSFVVTDVMLRANGYFLDVDPFEAHKFMNDAIAKKEFRSPQIREWIRGVIKALDD